MDKMKKFTYDPAKALAGLQEIERSLSIGKQQFFTDAHAFITNADPTNDILCDIDNIKLKVTSLIRLVEIELPLTLAKLEAMENGAVFARGSVPNAPDGIYMTSENVGKELMWAAKRGHARYDWCIYIHWAESGFDFVLSNGDKVWNVKNIKKLVSCDDESLLHYRY